MSAPAQRWPAHLETLLRLLLGGLLVWAALNKILHPDKFLDALWALELPLLGDTAARFLAVTFPWLELLTGLLLVLNRLPLESRLLALVLYALFLLVTASAWARGLRAACGCFGGVSDEPTSFALATLRNAALTAAAAWLLLRAVARFRRVGSPR